MCFHFTQSQEATLLENRFQAEFINKEEYKPPSFYNGFVFPQTPIITNINDEQIILAGWGLKPQWAKENWDKKWTLNARFETIDEKPSFRNYTGNRCLILTDGFYEWQQVKNETKKLKYHIGFNGELFAYAGLYCHTEEEGFTYTIITMEAKGVMREIHNTKLRMPYALKTDDDFKHWLNHDLPDPNFDFSTKCLSKKK